MELCQLKMQIAEMKGVKLGGIGVVLAIVVGLFIGMFLSGVKVVAQDNI
jgi:hypothetical protein